MSRRTWTVAGALVILGSFGYLAWGGIGDNLVYFLTPTELMARGNDAVGEAVRLGGQVKPGSVQWDAEALDLRFVLTDGAREVRVHSKGAPPQMFRDGMGVIVEGSYAASGVFQSTSLMVKHSNEYQPPAHGEKPEMIYGDLPKR
ncbi:MAG TPA: cytochrome c maturation protein CcmE [Longimicrobiaceae bacterium]|nr:cytochrome c maturation protein CcmE [Longimicrobiaceae bacterium]